MTIREQLEQREREYLSGYASLSCNTLGREHPYEKDVLRTEYQRDRDRIIHSKSFRRLKHKTQAFVAPENDHYRTRLTHTLEVSQIARTISRALNLNEDLTEAIALGHDLGHTPFGHAGERALRSCSPAGFRHNEQSLRVVEYLEKDGQGLNLTEEVRDGIIHHRLSTQPITVEGEVVRLSDKIAYINHDVDDSIRAGIIREEDIPMEIRLTIGMSVKDRLNNMIVDVIMSSADRPHIRMALLDTMLEFREWLFANVYAVALPQQEEERLAGIIRTLYEYYKDTGMDDTQTCDMIAGMTDQYALDKYEEITGIREKIMQL